jgi:photosystem II stability/assembly factor-like uncharacterized protein
MFGASAGTTVAAQFADPVDTPSMRTAMAAQRPLFAVAMAGTRVVAAGERGHIVYSDDGGATWTQAAVPVSSDLVALSFPTPEKGWAVGHGGVVLHSADGGKSWVRQLDGRQAAVLAVEHLRAQTPDDRVAALIEQARFQLADADAGAPAPFLDVHFESERSGFVVGTFNRIFRTEDGGQTWTPWVDRVDNARELHFYSVRQGAGGRVFLTGEQGMVWRFDTGRQRFVQVPTPYHGTLFGAVVSPAAVVAFGMRGTVFVSTDEGRNWRQATIGSRANVTGGAALAGGGIVLATSAGELWRSVDGGGSFAAIKVKTGIPSLFAVDSTGAALALAGSHGARVVDLPADAHSEK